MVRSLSLKWVHTPRVTDRLRTGFLWPYIGVRTSLNSGHETSQQAQCRLVPLRESRIAANCLMKPRAADHHLPLAGGAKGAGGYLITLEPQQFATGRKKLERPPPRAASFSSQQDLQ